MAGSELYPSFKVVLMDMFNNKTEDAIDEVIDIVETENEYDPYEYKIEQMINLLTVDGDSALAVNQEIVNSESEEDIEGAVGFGEINDYCDKLLNMFPDACPTYLLEYCQKRQDHFNLHEIIMDLSKGEYTKKTVGFQSIFEQLTDMLPNADPEYLKIQAERLIHQPNDELQSFVGKIVKENDYPTLQDYLKREKLKDELSIYTTYFTIEKFVQIIPDPMEHFSVDYQPALLRKESTEEDDAYALTVLFNNFNYLREKAINKEFIYKSKNLIAIFESLTRMPKHFRVPRALKPLQECRNLFLLQEIAFLMNKQAIRFYIKNKNLHYRVARAEAEKLGLLQTCQCCFYDGLIPEECYFCKKNCVFCKECISRGNLEVIGKGETRFPCFANCDSEFRISTLQMVLNPKIFEPLLARIRNEEIKKANIEGLETCPFCDFCMVPSEKDKIFKCRNADCMKETCRQCGNEAHLPYGCNEIEYDEEVKRRTYIENKMTEALVRTCWKCSKQFFKESGCNKMTCICGAKMCYYCGQAVKDYNHFKTGASCPLYTYDLNKFHAERIVMSAAQAKEDLGLNANPDLLKIDPTEGLDTYFQGLAPVII